MWLQEEYELSSAISESCTAMDMTLLPSSTLSLSHLAPPTKDFQVQIEVKIKFKSFKTRVKIYRGST